MITFKRLAAAIAGASAGPVKLGRITNDVLPLHENQIRTAPTTYSGVGGAPHDVLADHLEENDDPRHVLVRNRFTTERPWGSRLWELLGTDRWRLRVGGHNELSDGTLLVTHHITPKDLPRHPGVYSVTWITHRVDDEERTPIRSYGNLMSPEEYAQFHASLPPEARHGLLKPPTQKPVKNARAPDPTNHEALIKEAIRTKDPIALGVLADHLEETGLPGHSLLRMAMEQGMAHGMTLKETRPGADRHPNDIGSGFADGDWVGETGTASQTEFEPHKIEAYPFVGTNGVALCVLHTGQGVGEDQRLVYHIAIKNKSDFARALSSLPEPMQQGLIKQARRALRTHRTDFGAAANKIRLAREAVTYVGGSVPGGQRAIGVWNGGQEPSTILKIPAKQAGQIAVEVARRNKQKSAIWFVPGEGPDVLHRMHLPVAGAKAATTIRKILNRHGVNYATIIPENGGTSVHVVDKGGELAGPIRAFASQTRARYEASPGTAGFSQIKLHRVADPKAHDSFIDQLRGNHNAVTKGVFADWLEENGAPGAALARESSRAALAGEYDHHGKYGNRASNMNRYWDGADRVWFQENSSRRASDQFGVSRPYPPGEIGIGVSRYHADPRRGHPDGALGNLYVIHMPKSMLNSPHGIGYHVEVRDRNHFLQLTKDLAPMLRLKLWNAIRRPKS